MWFKPDADVLTKIPVLYVNLIFTDCRLNVCQNQYNVYQQLIAKKRILLL